MVTLLQEPSLLDRLQQDRSLIASLVEESLRHDPPIQVLMRLTTRATEVAGVEIPKGKMVMVCLGSANRDERRFPNPSQFDIERNTQGHLGFGFGNHFCLGASLARLEASIALDHLLERLVEPRLSTPEVAYHGSFLIRGPSTLPMSFASNARAQKQGR